MSFQWNLGGCTDFVAAVCSGADTAISVFSPNVEFGVLDQRLSCFEGALVVSVVANQHFVEQRGARRPQCQQHGEHYEHNDDE